MGFDIQIQQTYGQIGLDIYNSQLSIQQPKADLRIDQEPTKLRVDSELPKVLIDQYQCFAEAGLKNNRDLTADYAARGKRAALQAIGKIASDGDALMRVRPGVNTLAQLDAAMTFAPPAQSNITMIPKSRPKIQVTGGISINWETNKLNIDARPNAPTFEASKPSIETYLLQRPSIMIEYIGQQIDQRV